MRTHLSLPVKILLLSFLNVFLLGLMFAVFVRVQYRFDLSSLLFSPGRDRILSLSRLIALQLPNADRKDWDQLLARYSSTTHAAASLFNGDGTQLAGPPVSLPEKVKALVRQDEGLRVVTGPPPPGLAPVEGMMIRVDHGPLPPPPKAGPVQGAAQGTAPTKDGPGVAGTVFGLQTIVTGGWQTPDDFDAVSVRVVGPKFPDGNFLYAPAHAHPPRPFPVFLLGDGKPLRYWVGVHVPVFDRATMRPDDATLVWTFNSLWTNPFFFDYKPWLLAALAVILVSAACWLPLIRGLTRAISQLTDATGAIAEGQLDTRLSLRRGDEIGRLSESINSMAERLSGYVHGQRRFLSDVAHELCSPIARIQVALGILDQRAHESQKKYVEGLQEEIEQMSGLVSELLLFSRAQLNASRTPLTRVKVAETVRRVLGREGDGANIDVQVDERMEVQSHPEYLFRSLANVVRNAVRYAGECGPIQILAVENGDGVTITVADNGPGIPEAELEAVFKPFYRPELARQRETGGVGLGLAIVRTCIEACGGTVRCRNRPVRGLEVAIQFPKAAPASQS